MTGFPAVPRPCIPLNASRALAFVAASVLMALLARALLPSGAQGCVISFQAGIYLAVLLLAERRQWLYWTLLALASEAGVHFGLYHVHKLTVALDVLGHVAGMLLAASLIRRRSPAPFVLGTVGDTWRFVLLTALPGAAFSAGMQLAVSLLEGNPVTLAVWLRNWTSCVGGVVVAPVIITWHQAGGRLLAFARGRRLEAAVLAVLLISVSHMVFTTRLPLVYLLLPLLVWVALRFDIACTALALALTALMALYQTSIGSGPYADPAYPPALRSALAQSFAYMAEVGGLILAAAIARLRVALADLRDTQADLERRVAARTAALADSERNLRDNMARFRLARAAARIIVADWDIANDRLYFSESPEWLRGPLPVSGVYPLFKDQVHAEDREHFLHMRQVVLETLQGQTVQFRLVRTDNMVLHIQSHQTVITGGDGRAARLIAIQQDITERRAAETALRESEQRLRLVLDAIPDYVHLKDARGRFVMVNRATRELIGKSEAEIIGRTAFELPEAPAEPVSEHDVRLLAAGEVLRVERRSHFNPMRWRDEINAPIRSADGSISGIVSVSRDITARKMAELEVLRASEERYRTLVEQASDWIYLTDTRGCFTYSNSAAIIAMLGYSSDELLGRHIRELLHPDGAQAAIAFYDRQLRERAPTTYLEICVRARDGRTLWLGQHVQLVIEDGIVLYYQAVCRDVTDRVAAERALSESNDRLRRLAARQEALLEAERVRIAHNLHDGIGQSINLARIKLAGLATRMTLGALERELRDVMRVIDGASSVIRTLEFDLSPPVLRELGLEPALEWLAEEMARTYDLHVSVSRDDEAKPLSQTSRAVVFRAVRELLINVARHAGVPEAHVDTQCERGELVVTISDEGCGFDAKATPRGLGLTGVHERLAHLGGSASINSLRGDGTVVRLALPLGREGEMQ